MTRHVVAAGLLCVLAAAALATARAEAPPSLKQLAAGVPLGEIRCNGDMVPVQNGGRPACVSEPSAQKLLQRGWTFVLPLQDQTERPDMRAELPAKTITTGNVNNTWTGLSSRGWGSYLWPQYSLTFPDRVRVGEQFEVVLDYTFIIHADDYDRYGVAEIMGFPKEREKVQCTVQCMENLRRWNSTFDIETNAYVDLLDADYVMIGSGYDERHIPVREFEWGAVPPVFNNTHPQQRTLTFVINEPDTEYPFGHIRIDWNWDGKGWIHFYVEPGNMVRLSDEPIIVEGEGIPRLGLNLPDPPIRSTTTRDPLSSMSDPDELIHALAPFLEEHYPDSAESELRLANFTDAFIERFFKMYPELRAP